MPVGVGQWTFYLGARCKGRSNAWHGKYYLDHFICCMSRKCRKQAKHLFVFVIGVACHCAVKWRFCGCPCTSHIVCIGVFRCSIQKREKLVLSDEHSATCAISSRVCQPLDLSQGRGCFINFIVLLDAMGCVVCCALNPRRKVCRVTENVL